jgi:alpha-L-rhamnosidase
VNYAMAALQVAEIASAIGKPNDAAAYLALAALLSDSIRGKFWNGVARHWDAGSQSAQAMCLAFGLGGPEVQAAASAALLSALSARNGHLTVGASGAQVLLRTLHKIEPAAALALALQTSYPSWAAFLIENSTFSPVPMPGYYNFYILLSNVFSLEEFFFNNT